MRVLKGLVLGAFAGVAACAGSPAPEAETAPYVGRWAADPAWCANKPGETDALPITITETAFLGYENECEMDVVATDEAGVYSIRRQCVGEGVPYEDDISVSINNDRMTLTTAEGRETEFYKCD